MLVNFLPACGCHAGSVRGGGFVRERDAEESVKTQVDGRCLSLKHTDWGYLSVAMREHGPAAGLSRPSCLGTAHERTLQHPAAHDPSHLTRFKLFSLFFGGCLRLLGAVSESVGSVESFVSFGSRPNGPNDSMDPMTQSTQRTCQDAPARGGRRSALDAFAQARDKAVVCFAHVTNQMGRVEGDFEKGERAGGATPCG